MFALKQLLIDCAACYEAGFFSRGSNELLMSTMKTTLKDLRPHMIPLTELNTTPEMDLSYLSAIGNEYGDIYET